MARAVKRGLDYFSMDVHLDDKFQLLEAEHGVKGFAVVVKLFQKIYGEQGYYCGWDSEVALLFSRACGLGANVVSEIVDSALRRKIFDAEMLAKYGILTSSGIQKRYLEATERRRQVELIEEYLLLDIHSLPQNVYINPLNVYINPLNVYGGTQSKVKQSKAEESSAPAPARPDFNTTEAYASSNLDYLSPYNMQELESFISDLGDELVRHAIDEACANGKRSYAYVRSIMSRYKQSGFTSIGQVLAEEERRKQQKQPEQRPVEPKVRWSL